MPMHAATLLYAVVALVLAPVCGAQTLAVRISEPPLELVQDTERFHAFARRLAVEVDRQLAGESAAATSDAQKKLLGLRAHLALYLGESEIALRTAATIRALQSDPAERAHSGLATQALVAARGDAAKFEAEFARLLVALPREAAIREVLLRGRARIAAMTEAALLGEFTGAAAAKFVASESLTVEQADAIVRVGHRLRTILPLRDAMLRAYDAGIARQR